MTETSWPDLEPQPGDFDAGIEGEHASRLQHISAARGEKPTDVIADLFRAADSPAA
jgi:hypothetical protein